MAEVPYISTALLANVSKPYGACAGHHPRGWRRLPAWARWGLITLAMVIALGWPLAPAAREVM